MLRLALALALLVVPAPLAHAAGPPSIRTLAGNGQPGFAGDGGRSIAAQLNAPTDVAAAPDGSIYIADTVNQRVRRIDPAGRITTIAGTGVGGFGGDGGPATAALLSTPSGLALGPDGSLYVADTGNNRIRRITPDGLIATVVGDGTADYLGDGGLAVVAQIQGPLGLAVDATGALYIADSGNDRIRRVGLDGIITTFAGTVGATGAGFAGDGGPANAAVLDSPADVAVDALGQVLIADGDNARIRRVGLDGVITTIAGIGATYTSTGDGGPATAASLNSPLSVAADASGAVYVSEIGGYRLRKIAADGTITAFAGTTEGGDSGDLGPATAARMNAPVGIAVDTRGRVLIADRDNHRIKRVGDLAAEVGKVGKAVLSGRPGGPAKTQLPATARRLCAAITFSTQPEYALPVVIRFKSTATKTFGLKPVTLSATGKASACVSAPAGATLRAGTWRVVVEVAKRPVRTVTLRVLR